MTLIGFLSDDNPGIDDFLFKGTGATTRSITVGDRTQLHDLIQAVTTTGLTPVIDDTFEFTDAKKHSNAHAGQAPWQTSHSCQLRPASSDARPPPSLALGHR